MEKMIIFLPVIIFFGIFLLLVIGFFVFIGKLFIKGKNQAWIGEVIEKVVFEKKDDDTRRVSRLLSFKVRLENGEVHSIPATVEFYNATKVGDKLEKKKGELWPKKIS
ncbi:hypothetical protein COY90_02210 [Candidatus Roizmanbacteria bacterium CG_4_10_14_0_8_um_filter_39_9]|uniref:DUF7489 domain-containing protein n=1 Tax=Candidatus Roizmanbacteria bacterium CG_4_10_14_0_8_um_filter_39_9 TaxID=1974829 RepID=A0A2M7QD36_9BACT|nr:MAG: hypothetical protein COY90_02210 [Candidatus Roizmanbacteria bacterium CG_4_10_14_0_8_um_filter_39_9]